MSVKKTCTLFRLFQSNILIGVLVSLLSVYFMATGSYASLSERIESEAMLNLFLVGGFIYSAIFWYINTFAVRCGSRASA